MPDLDADMDVARRVVRRWQSGVVTQRRMSTAEEESVLRATMALFETVDAIRQALPPILEEIEAHRRNVADGMCVHHAHPTTQ